MAQFWALSTNDDTLVGCALAPFNEKVDLLKDDAGGWGLGYYSRGELLQRVEPRGQAAVLDIGDVVRDIRADMVIMHARSATVGTVRRENIHPFRFKDWLFAHNGTTIGFEAIKGQLIESMPSFIQRNIKGETDSEHIFHLFLSFLYDAGMLNRPDAGMDAIAEALIRTFATVDELLAVSGQPKSSSSMVVSDGYSFVVGSRGVPVEYTVIEGISHCTNCRVSVDPVSGQASGVDHPALKAALVRSGGEPDTSGQLTRLEDDTLLIVSRIHKVTLRKFT